MARTKSKKGYRKRRYRRRNRPLVGPPIQYHHERYEPEDGEVVGETAGHLFKGEHGHITGLRRQTRNISTWFIVCLRRWLDHTMELHESGIRPLRDLDAEIEALAEGQSYHCRFCGRGFLIKRNKEKHQLVCRSRDDSISEQEV